MYVDENLGSLKSDFVVIDPNKRDLLYCLGTNDEKRRYTQPQRSKETRKRKYSRILEGQALHQEQFVFPRSTVDRDEFDAYLQSFFSRFSEREQHYRDALYRKLRLNTYINTQKSESQFLKSLKTLLVMDVKFQWSLEIGRLIILFADK